MDFNCESTNCILKMMVFSHALVGSLATKQITKNKKFTSKQLSVIYFVGIISAVLPDFDTIILIFDNSLVHREFLTHSFIPYLVLALIATLIAKLKKSRFLNMLVIAFSVGVLGHILFDLFYGGVVALAPFDYKRYGIEMNFKFTNRIGWAQNYFSSVFLIGELLILIIFLLSMKKIKNKVGRYLPLLFVLASFLMLAVITFI